MKPIYEPKGKAKEYGDLAINIYTGCPHRCFYCYAPSVLKKDRETFFSVIEPRKDIVNEVKKQIEREGITGKLIHLCFTCDPYPKGYDSSPTREIIKIIKNSGNHVQILTKNLIDRDFDLFDEHDNIGITVTGDIQKKDEEFQNISMLYKSTGRFKTWFSCEPVLNADRIKSYILNLRQIDLFKIGKLNYHKSNIEWGKFGKEIEALCLKHKRNYYIKDDLRMEMDKC